MCDVGENSCCCTPRHSAISLLEFILRHIPGLPTSGKQVDVLALYNDKGLNRIGVTPQQIETLIANELPRANEATANSLVDLRFNLVHTEKVGDIL